MPTSRVKEKRPLPNGTYRLKLTKCVEKDSKAGDKYLRWTSEVVDTYKGGEPGEDLTGFEFGHNTNSDCLKQSAYHALLTACGMPDQEGDFDIDTDDFLGLEYVGEVTVKATTYGQDANFVKKVWSVDDYTKETSKSASAGKKVMPVKAGAVKPTVPSNSGTVKPAVRKIQPQPQEEVVEEGAEVASGSDLEFPD